MVLNSLLNSKVTERLIKQGLTVSKFDPCLFMNKLLIIIVYVNDILIYGW
jgi:hypothetical protein